MKNSTLSKIRIGFLVGLKKNHENPETLLQFKRWIGAYGRGPFFVFAMCDDEYVSLKNSQGKETHFGSTADPSLNIGYIEPWCE